MGKRDGTLLTVGEAAERLKVSPATVRRWTTAGDLRAERTEGGHRRYRPEDVDRLRVGRAISESTAALSVYEEDKGPKRRRGEVTMTVPDGKITYDSVREANPDASERDVVYFVSHRREIEKVTAIIGRDRHLFSMANELNQKLRAIMPAALLDKSSLGLIGKMAAADRFGNLDHVTGFARDILTSDARDALDTSMRAIIGDQNRDIVGGIASKLLSHSSLHAGALAAANALSSQMAHSMSSLLDWNEKHSDLLNVANTSMRSILGPIIENQGLMASMRDSIANVQFGLDYGSWLKGHFPQEPEDDVEAFGTALAADGWVLPSSLPDDLWSSLWALFDEGRMSDAEAMLVTHYSADDWVLASEMSDSWSGLPCFCEVSQVIGESITAARAELYHPAVCTLITQIEGVLTRYVVTHSLPPLPGATDRERGKFLSSGVRKAKAMLSHATTTDSDELIERANLEQVLVVFFFGFTDFSDFLQSPNGGEIAFAARHLVTHGIASDGYGTPGQFLRSIFVLDRLSDVVRSAEDSTPPPA